MKNYMKPIVFRFAKTSVAKQRIKEFAMRRILDLQLYLTFSNLMDLNRVLLWSPKIFF